MIKTCECCEQPFEATDRKRRFCSKRCSYKKRIRFLITPQEARIATLLMQGYTCRQIANILVVQVGSIHVCMYRLRQKLGVRCQSEALAEARKLLPNEERQSE